MNARSWMLMVCAAVSPVLANDTGRAASIVEITPQDLSSVRAGPVRTSEQAALEGVGTPLERSRELYRSSDGRLAVAVSWTDPLNLRFSAANADEVVFLQESDVEIERRPVRSLLSVTGIAMACGVMIVGNFQQGAINFMVDVQFGLSQRDDLSVSFVEPIDTRALAELRSLPGVSRVEAQRVAPVRLRFEHRSFRNAVQGVDRGGTPVAWPEAMRERIRGFEAVAPGEG